MDVGHHGRDGLSSCACQRCGIQTYGSAEDTTPAEWDRTMAVNLRSCYLTSHFMYPLAESRRRCLGGSCLVGAGHNNQNRVLAYATTKGAVHALTRAMAMDCAADSIRVNSISPGSIRTPLLEFSASQLATGGKSIDDMIASSVNRTRSAASGRPPRQAR